MKKANYILLTALVLSIFSTVFGQQENNKDQTLRGSGRINPSTLAMEFDLPLGAYPGRGINVPISLSYSSKVWRAEYINTRSRNTDPQDCIAVNMPEFAEDSAAGWTTSLATPYIEYVGKDNIFTETGAPAGSLGCDPEAPSANYNVMIKRIVVHLPSGETHELQPDNPVMHYPISEAPPTFVWNTTFYAIDGSNIRYVENAATGVYKLLMPDGSYYVFGNLAETENRKTIRKAQKFYDRNGNFTSYNAANGTWTDTLGRTLSAPIGLKAPAQPVTQTYSMPGMTGNYKFYWKKLKGSTAAESALTDFNQELKYQADRSSVNPNGTTRDNSLFHSYHAVWIHDGGAPLFNPVLLAAIELPTGQKYQFNYDIFGRIEKIIYPTGGEERFVYSVIKPLTPADEANVSEQMNFGVTHRKVLKSAGDDSPYEWTYAVSDDGNYTVTIDNPDETRTERTLHRGGGVFGYEHPLSGRAFEERGYDSAARLVTRKLTSHTFTSYYIPNTSEQEFRHPRVTHEETQIFDQSGSGISATAAYVYDGDLNQRETPLLVKKSAQYAFVPVGSPVPAAPVRVSESTFLINDTAYPDWVRETYKSRNMVGLVTANVIRDGAGTIVARSEMKFDDGDYSPEIGRGNPTNARVWDSTKGNWDDPNAYIATRAKFDAYGNQYESIDALGNSTFTEFDSTHHAFPIKVTSAVPDPTNQNGSNTPFVTTATFDWVTGLPMTSTDANGLETRITYDWATLRPLNTKTYFMGDQVGGALETIYHDEPNNYRVKSRAQIDTDKWTENIAYFDGLGRAYKAEEINSNGNIIVEKEFDQDGRVKRITNPFRAGETKNWTTNVYDEASRVKEVILPDGAKIVTDYGVSAAGILGVTKQITDQAGKKRKGISDALGRMVRVVEDPDGQNLHTDYVFDTLGNLRQTIQGEQNRYFTFDSLGRLLYAKQPEQEANASFAHTDSITGNAQWSVKYEYDANGNITKTIDANGIYVAGIYDNFNRLKSRNYSDDTPDVSFYYDGRGLGDIPEFSKGKTTKVTSSVSETRYTSFDVLGRLLSSEQRTPFGSETVVQAAPRTFTYQYNLTALVAETYPSGRTVSYDFDQNGDLARVSGQIGTVTRTYANSITYNASGAVESMRLGNGKWETAKYNHRQQITQIGLGSSVADQSLLKIDYDYGTATQNNGSLREQRINFAGLPAEIKQSYTYDDLNRLKSATETFNNGSPSWRQTFNYDRYGNRTFDAANTTTLNQSVSQKISNPTILSADNRLKKDQDNDNLIDYEYDKTGSVTLDAENKRFLYDAENRLRQFFSGTNTSNTPDAVYTYDGNGQRIRKKTADETVVFVYNASGTLAAEYSTTPAEHAKVSYLTADHLGSPRIITDHAGTVVSRHDYLSFGDEVTATLGSVAGRTAAQGYGAEDEIRKQYTGYERDKESGLDFAQARYYNSKHGRFTSVDPLTASANVKDPQTFNRYTYALNSPYKFTDPLGLISSNTSARGQDSNTQDKPRKKRKTQKKQNASPPSALTPNRTIVVPAKVKEEARQTTSNGTLTDSNGNSENATINLPNSLVRLKEKLGDFTYTQQGAAANQDKANKRTGNILPKQGTVSESETQSQSNSESSSVGGELDISVTPGVKGSLNNSDGTENSVENQSSSELSGPSTDIRGTINYIETETNKAIVNYLNANCDKNGNMEIEVVNSEGKKTKALWSREGVKRHLTTFVQRVRNQADSDFGGN